MQTFFVCFPFNKFLVKNLPNVYENMINAQYRSRRSVYFFNKNICAIHTSNESKVFIFSLFFGNGVEIFCLMLFRSGNCANCKAPLSGHSVGLSFLLPISLSIYLCVGACVVASNGQALIELCLLHNWPLKVQQN